MRFWLTFSAGLLICCSLSQSVFGQLLGGGGNLGGNVAGGSGSTTTTVSTGADTGSIYGTPCTSPDKANCWVIRTYNTATAVCVYEDPVFHVPMANLRNYTKNSTGFTSQNTTVTLPAPANTTQSLDVVKVRLEEVRDSLGRVTFYNMNYYPDGYNTDGTPKGTKVAIGKMKFGKGSHGRGSSDVTIRLGSSVRPTANPCDEPPLDDLGEEEEIPVSSSKVPGLLLPLSVSSQVAP